MSLLVDPRICPDCRAALDPDRTCTGCGLRLTGTTAAELWQLMQRADALITRLRSEAGAPAGTAPTGVPATRPAAPPVGPSPTTSRGPSLSVPVVLLGLGALCVLVAAIVFVAVTWSSLGLGAKASIMLGVTGLFAAGGTALTRRGLRGGAETLWVIVAVLLVVDLVAAYGADLAGFGDLPGRHAVALTGAVLLLLAIGVGGWAARTPTGRLNGLVGAGLIGGLMVTVAEVFAAGRPEVAATLALPLTLALAVLIHRGPAPLRPTAYAVGVPALLSWATLMSIGIDRGVGATVAQWWQGLDGWPLLVAAGYTALVTRGTRLPAAVRILGSSATLTALFFFALGGTARSETATVATACAIAVALAAVSAFGSRVWAFPAGLMSAVAGVAGGLFVVGRPWNVIAGLPTTGPADDLNLGLRLPAVADSPAPWTAVVVAAAVVVVAAGLLRHVPEPFRVAVRTGLFALAPTVLALGGATAFGEYEPRLVTAVLAWGVVLVLAAGAAVAAREHPVALGTALLAVAYLALVGLRTAVPSHLLAAALASALAAALTTAYARSRTDRLHGTLLPLLAGGAVVAAGFAGTHWPYLADGAGDTAGLVLVALAALALLGAAPGGRTEPARRTVEVTAILLGLVATQFPTDGEVSALVLTVLGSAVALTAILNRDRDLLGWGAVVLLGVATVVRLDLGVAAPELFTVPAALVLVGGGVHRLRTDPGASSMRALSSGLVLGLVPSLLLALDEPVTGRGALIAAAGVLVLGAGVRARWTAPVLAGSLTVALLALRHLGPVAEAVPRWVSLAALGLVFLLVGITWEARRRDVARADRYLASLR